MRYLGLSNHDRLEMMKRVGVSNINDIYLSEVPSDIIDGDVPIGNHLGELEVERYISNLAKKNFSSSNGNFFLGAGCYNHHVPASVDAIIQRSEFLTSYTPYQPEISQGTLQVIFEFQSMISAITGMEVANASMYDGATSLLEAVLMSMRLNKKSDIIVANNLHPDYDGVLSSYFRNSNTKILHGLSDTNSASCVIVQYPDFFGNIDQLRIVREFCDKNDAIMIVVNNEILAFGLLPAPSVADIVVGEARSLGNAMNFGGPSLGYFATKKQFVRQMPGRICGVTKDKNGKMAFVLTLNAREQHIRREKATSNICSNQGLCATAFTIHVALLGESGFKKLAEINHAKAVEFYKILNKVKGIRVINKNFFNEFTIETSGVNAKSLHSKLLTLGINAGLVIDNNKLLLAVTELTTSAEMQFFADQIQSEIHS